jgi:hypothetical protein
MTLPLFGIASGCEGLADEPSRIVVRLRSLGAFEPSNEHDFFIVRSSSDLSRSADEQRRSIFVINDSLDVPASVASRFDRIFTVENEAQQHCPSDTIVWVNTPTGVYHLKGMRWYGNTNHGAYVCKKEGDEAGYRATRNGQ